MLVVSFPLVQGDQGSSGQSMEEFARPQTHRSVVAMGLSWYHGPEKLRISW